jgi:hypothetical protein
MSLDFLDDRQKVVKRANGGQRWCLRVAQRPAGDGQRESFAHDFERELSLMEIPSQPGVTPAGSWGRSWQSDVVFQEPIDIELSLESLIGIAVHAFFLRRAAASFLLSWTL